ncbi:uncharacterized protein LOC135712240 [Ochlerotatus camptorhynchus]|uniref:uncharacterized protein LOC135712240 n=1 Tax=Ochlerotatus camptorhynchus TaxID=644619 RepID=UPI0031CE0762
MRTFKTRSEKNIEFVDFLNERQINIAITETHLKPELNVFLPDFQLVRLDRTSSGGGGVVIATRRNISWRLLPSFQLKTIEAIGVEELSSDHYPVVAEVGSSANSFQVSRGIYHPVNWLLPALCGHSNRLRRPTGVVRRSRSVSASHRRDDIPCQGATRTSIQTETRKFYQKLNASRNGFVLQAEMCKDKDGQHFEAHLNGEEDVGTGDQRNGGNDYVSFRGLLIAINAGHKTFSHNANGVYYEPECMSNLDGLDHAVVAVVYGKLKREDYWLIKNSWSNYWGNDVYALMVMKAHHHQSIYIVAPSS